MILITNMIDTKMNLFSSNGSSMYREFINKFANKCFSILESTSRVDIFYHEVGVASSEIHVEKFAMDSMTPVFSKFLSRLSEKDFEKMLKRLIYYSTSKALEPQVAGMTFHYMLKGAFAVNPDKVMDMFLPLISSKIEQRLDLIQHGQSNMLDKELQFHELSLVSMFQLDQNNITWAKPLSSSTILKHWDLLCSLLDKILCLEKYEEYIAPLKILENLLNYILQARPFPIDELKTEISSSINNVKVKWYVPDEAHLEIVKDLIDKYLIPELELLNKWSVESIELSKEEINRSLCKIACLYDGVYKFLPLINKKPNSQNLMFLEVYQITPRNGGDIHQMIIEIAIKVQDSILKRYPDNSEGLTFLLKIYKLYTGIGISKLNANDVNLEKNQLVRGKEHLMIAHIGRIYNSHLNILQSHWKQNFNIDFSDDLIQRIYTLATSSYQNVRTSSTDLVTTICNRNAHLEKNRMFVVSLMKKSLKKDVPLQENKAVLRIISDLHFKSWKQFATLFPELLELNIDEKTSDTLHGQSSIVELLKVLEFPDYFLPVTPTTWNCSEKQQLDDDFSNLRDLLIKNIRTGSLPRPIFNMSMNLLKQMHSIDQEICVDVFELWLDHLNYPDDINIRKSAISVSIHCL